MVIGVTKGLTMNSNCLYEELQFANVSSIFYLLKLFATLLLFSCSCERLASMLRRLNNYLRFTQKYERLTALGLIHTHYHAANDVDTVHVR